MTDYFGFCVESKALGCSRFSNSHRNVSKNARSSLLLANNSSSCSQSIWENMGKWCSVYLPWFGLEEESNKDDEEASSPHLAGLVWVAEYSVEWREREVITVVKLTGNVASPWRLVMIASAGNNKTSRLCNYWPASLTLDKSNNARYPHIPFKVTPVREQRQQMRFAAQEAE